MEDRTLPIKHSPSPAGISSTVCQPPRGLLKDMPIFATPTLESRPNTSEKGSARQKMEYMVSTSSENS